MKNAALHGTSQIFAAGFCSKGPVTYFYLKSRLGDYFNEGSTRHEQLFGGRVEVSAKSFLAAKITRAVFGPLF